VVIFPDLAANFQVYNQFLTSMQLPAVAQLKTTPTKVSGIELKNPIFKDVFETLPQNLDLPQVNKYFEYTERNNSNVERIMFLPANKLFMSKYTLGNGKVYLAATDLNVTNSNLATHPVFVPLMYKIAFTSAVQQPIYYTIGDDVLESNKITLATNQTLKLVADEFEVIPELRQTPGKTLLYVADQVRKPGFYTLQKADYTLAIIAFNQNSTESDMHYAAQADLERKFGKQEVQFLDPTTTSISSAVAIKNNGLELWKLCLILTLIFIAAEILLIRFYHLQKQTNS